jgi:hypothetical protein
MAAVDLEDRSIGAVPVCGRREADALCNAKIMPRRAVGQAVARVGDLFF